MKGEELDHVMDGVYETMEGSEAAMAYDDRHNISSLGILTVTNQNTAKRIAQALAPSVRGKTVIEIGAGIGLLALELASYARRVFAIEADPGWSWVFVEHLYKQKPPNLSWLFGAAEEFGGLIRGDVAIFCTRSGRESMRRAAGWNRKSTEGDYRMTDKIDDVDIMDRARALLELERIEHKDGDQVAWMGLKYLAMPPSHVSTGAPDGDGHLWRAATMILMHLGAVALMQYRDYLRRIADGNDEVDLPGIGRPLVKMDDFLYRYEGGGRLLDKKRPPLGSEPVMNPEKVQHLAETARGIAIFQKPDAEGWPDGVLPHDDRERLVKAADAVLDDLGVTNRKPAPAPGSGSS